LIRHGRAPTSAQVTHRLTVIGLTLGAPLVPCTRLAPAPSAASTTAFGTAVGVPTIAAAADEEDGSTPRARTHPQRFVGLCWVLP
jgi:hypothetical protein